ncbi:16S rRNA (cytosine(967)-C(5))-methyltransferase RsmB [Effusibacillus dendaii]|uniref:16S rRNA (cytosine(967)-C(5))-methyltransferase n=1 Tax=Effusibacillus dendaii TaxID=2743772 RepID=A0A7I8D4X5_9BACL|nr:16S rRNA (cytosine(967)-C(5))-methyltransferase RsmB [Effusibacillus dendaii]BCJ85125.1 ribosomal RNA small subunit methyltransferase B [Effusibacillus dendaii]
MATRTNNRRQNKTARDLALDVLLSVEEQAAYSNLALQSALANHRLDPKDASLVTEIVYGTIQRLNTLDYRLHFFLKQPLAKLDGWVRNLLRMSVYQIDYLDRVPDFAVIHEAVEIAKRRNSRLAGFVNAVLRNLLRAGAAKFPSAEKEPTRHLSLLYSHPEWLLAEWVEQYGFEETTRILEANNGRPHLSLRANRMRGDREALQTALQKRGIESALSEVSPDGIVLKTGVDIAHLPEFQAGLCTVQDESSMLVALSVNPQPGMRILDACSAPGGKTTHLAECMNDDGEVVAVDIHEHKTKLVQHAAERLGLRSIRTEVGDAAELSAKWAQQFDAVLLDAPCSGFGVIRRKPDIKWRKTMSDVDAIHTTQLSLLRHAADAVKPGGVLVYSTCTIERKENQQIVRTLLEERSDFSIEPLDRYLPEAVVQKAGQPDGWLQLLPHHFGTDGFFICRMRKM